MPSSLPSALSLIKDSWKLFITTWKESLKITIWILYAGLALFATSIVEKFAPGFGLIAQIIVYLAVFFIVYWTGIRLMKGMLALDAGKPLDLSPKATRESWNLMYPLAWVALLQTLVVVGGFVLLIIPGIWLAVALSYSQLIAIDQGIRGSGALAASRALVRGRWWAVLWRQAATNLVFGLGIAAVSMILTNILLSIAGTNAMNLSNPDPILVGAFNLLSYTLQAGSIALIVAVQVKLYRALQTTKS